MMHFCHKCHRPIELNGNSRDFAEPVLCSTCQYSDVSATTDADWINVARVQNLAEAGFLANDLMDHQIDSRILQKDEFSALDGAWAVSYLIQVPCSVAGKAADRIRLHAESDFEEDAYAAACAGGANFAGSDSISDPLWRGFALLVLGGMMGFAFGQRFAPQSLERRAMPPRNSLPAFVEAVNRPFLTEPAGGEPRHRLYYQRHNRSWYLETDGNGDGRFETQQRFDAQGFAHGRQ